MALGALAAGITGLIAFVLCLQLLASVRRRWRPSHLLWSVGFLLAALAAFTQLVGYLSGHFPPGLYRFYLFSSASVPGFMGAGTVYLLWRRLGHAFAAFTTLLGLLGLVGAFTTRLHATLLSDVTLSSADVARVATSGLLALVYALQGAIGGFLALVGGAIYSYIRTRRGQNLLIALGGLLFGVADTLAAYGGVAGFFPAEIVGMLLLFYGIVQGRSVADQERERLSA